MQIQDQNDASFDYDVCLSFAGEEEERKYVYEVANRLRERGIRVFYDKYEDVTLWGKDLYAHLDDVYRHSARYCVMFISKNYAERLWTNHERRSAQARAMKANSEYILPARFDSTEVSGLPDTVGYVDLREVKMDRLVEMILQKIGPRQNRSYLPPVPDRLFDSLGVEDDTAKDVVHICVSRFLETLNRMSKEERNVVFQFVLNACLEELPDNLHINIDLLRRYTGSTPRRLRRVLGGLQSLGFETCVRDDEETNPGYIGKSEMLVLRWHDMRYDGMGNSTDVMSTMIQGATEGYCQDHAMAALDRLDFSQLGTATTEIDEH